MICELCTSKEDLYPGILEGLLHLRQDHPRLFELLLWDEYARGQAKPATILEDAICPFCGELRVDHALGVIWGPTPVPGTPAPIPPGKVLCEVSDANQPMQTEVEIPEVPR